LTSPRPHKGLIPAQRVGPENARTLDPFHKEDTHVLPLYVKRAMKAIDNALDDADTVAPCRLNSIKMDRLRGETIAESALRLAPAAGTCRECPAMQACRNWAATDKQATGIIGGVYYNGADPRIARSLNKAIRRVLNDNSERIG
jgi:hypothetical protein